MVNWSTYKRGKSIISIEVNINIMFFLFKTNPKIPIKKSIKDKFITIVYS